MIYLAQRLFKNAESSRMVGTLVEIGVWIARHTSTDMPDYASVIEYKIRAEQRRGGVKDRRKS